MPFGIASAVGAVGGGLIAANASNKASDAQQQSAQAALDLQRQQFDTGRAESAPYRQTGIEALNRISDLLNLSRPAPTAPTAPDRESFAIHSGKQGGGGILSKVDPLANALVKAGALPDGAHLFSGQPGQKDSFDQTGYDAAMAKYQQDLDKYNQDLAAFNSRPTGVNAFQADPGYEFRLGEGNKEIENAARARGQYFSPSTVKELTRYGQGFASNEFSNVFNRLSGLAGTGQTQVNTDNQLGSNYAAQAGNIGMNAANARGAAAISQANTWGSLLSGAANAYNQNQMLSQLIKGYGGSTYRPSTYSPTSSFDPGEFNYTPTYGDFNPY